MRTSYLCLVVLGWAMFACAPSRKQTQAAVVPSSVHYALPQARPSEELRLYLEDRLVGEPDNAIYHRDLGTLYQSRTTLVQPPERWRLLRLANKHLEKAFQTLPGDPQTVMFLGMARAYRGKDPEVGIMNRLSTVLEGFSLIDKAVTMDPENFSLRLLRAKADLMAPAMLGRSKTLNQDYAFLLPKTTTAGAVPPYLQALGLIFLGDFEAVNGRMDKAKTYWAQAEALDTHFKEEAAKRHLDFEAGP